MYAQKLWCSLYWLRTMLEMQEAGFHCWAVSRLVEIPKGKVVRPKKDWGAGGKKDRGMRGGELMGMMQEAAWTGSWWQQDRSVGSGISRLVGMIQRTSASTGLQRIPIYELYRIKIKYITLHDTQAPPILATQMMLFKHARCLLPLSKYARKWPSKFTSLGDQP